MTNSLVSCSLIDVCLSCYLTDHHNRAGELLLGVPVDGRTRYWHVKQGLKDEFRSYGGEISDIPESIPDEAFEAAINDCFADVKHHFAKFDSSLDIIGDDEGGDEMCQAWFLFTWEVERDDNDE